jgi:hypothetical protein
MPSSILAGTKSAARIEPISPTNRVEPGQEVVFESVILYEGIERDPDALSFIIKSPTGVPTIYTSDVDEELEHVDIGKYRIKITIPLAQNSVGTWAWTWTATGGFSSEVVGETEVHDVPDSVTLTVQDTNVQPIQRALISVFRGPALVQQRRTDDSGQAQFPLRDGFYTVEVQKDGYRASPVYLTVSGATAAIVTATRLVEQQIPILKLCRVWGHVIDMSGIPLPDTNVYIEPVGMSMQAFVSSGTGAVNQFNQGVAREKRAIRTRASDGYWEVDLLQGSIVRIYCPALGLQRVFRVPEETMVNLADIRTDVPMPSVGASRDRIPYV